jgi:hypothetical integral membrane protein (TIGR02206 family)
VLGAAGLVWLGRAGPARAVTVSARLLAVLILGLNVVMEVYRFRPSNVGQSLPLQLSDLAPYAAGIALWTGDRRASALTYYWGLTLSIQALITPVLSGPDFPNPNFIAFFAIHVFVVWAAIFLTWGVRLRQSWAGYRFTVLLTAVWAALMFVLNRYAGSNYGFLNAKPSTGSLLDLLGPWPWYLLPECALVLAAWALMTLPWAGSRGRVGSQSDSLKP